MPIHRARPRGLLVRAIVPTNTVGFAGTFGGPQDGGGRRGATHSARQIVVCSAMVPEALREAVARAFQIDFAPP